MIPPPAQSLAEIIQRRRTLKVLADPANPIQLDPETRAAGDHVVADALKVAGWAPFHYDRGADGLAEPWRVDWLREAACRQVAQQLPAWCPDLKPNNKLPAMLSACGSLVLVSWLPQFASVAASASAAEMAPAKRLQVDREHLAAAAAYVQNLLLLLTAAGLGTYWSSGGQLADHSVFEHLGISHRGHLVAAVFVDYLNEQAPDLERLPGKQRDRRDPQCRWIQEVPELA